MTLIEVKCILYGILAALLVFIGFRFGSQHVQAQWNIDKLHAAQELTREKSANATLTDQIQALQNAAEEKYAADQKASADTLSAVTNSVRSAESAARALAVYAAVDHSPGATGAGGSAGFAQRLEQSISGLNDAFTKFSARCLDAGDRLDAIQAAAPKQVTGTVNP